MYKILFSRKAENHKSLLKQAKLDKKAKNLLDIIAVEPFKTPPSYEKLIGELNGVYSRRINHRHRLVYTVDEANAEIFILSMWMHYEDI